MSGYDVAVTTEPRPSEADVARQVLEGLLLGPTCTKSAASPVARGDHSESPPLSEHQRALRSALDGLTASVREHQIRYDEARGPFERLTRSHPGGAALARRALLRALIDEFVEAQLPALSGFPWTRQWILGLVRQGLIAASLTYLDQALPLMGHDRSSRLVPGIPSALFEQVGIEPAKVDWVRSRRDQRKLIHAALESSLCAAFERETGQAANTQAYRSWRRHSDHAQVMLGRVEGLLELTHGARPFTLVHHPQIRYEATVWYLRQVRRQSFAQVAATLPDLTTRSPRVERPDAPTSRALRQAVARSSERLRQASVFP